MPEQEMHVLQCATTLTSSRWPYQCHSVLMMRRQRKYSASRLEGYLGVRRELISEIGGYAHAAPPSSASTGALASEFTQAGE